jgi:anaerobic ribonucleoside-triphosphate reductase
MSNEERTQRISSIDRELKHLNEELINCTGQTEQPTEIFARICGYARRVDNWNKGKRAEYADRKEYLS